MLQNRWAEGFRYLPYHTNPSGQNQAVSADLLTVPGLVLRDDLRHAFPLDTAQRGTRSSYFDR